MTEQATFVVTAVVVEVSTRRKTETLIRAYEPAQSFDGGRFVTAAHFA